MREIITVQLGQAGNYLGTHFWNTQESYFTYGDDGPVSAVSPDIHWRPGQGVDGTDTFLPRTVIYDLKGGFGSLRKINSLYDTTGCWDVPIPWLGAPVVRQLPEVPQTAYQQSLDAGNVTPKLTSSQVRYWSDFSRAYYHPNSLNQIYDYELNSSIQPFDKWSLGEDLFQSLEKAHDMMDRDLRPFIEEADQMQAIQVFTSLDDAWGGFAAQYLDRMRDEYPKTTLWTWGTQASRQARLQRLNLTRSIVAICKQVSMLVPLSLPVGRLPSNTCLAQDSLWERSALMSTAIETATLVSRLRQTEARRSLGDVVARINTNGGQTIGRLQMIASEVKEEKDEVDERLRPSHRNHDSAGDVIEFFNVTRRHGSSRSTGTQNRVFGQSITIRTSDQSSEGIDAGYDDLSPRWAGEEKLYKDYICLPFPILDSFPEIYKDWQGNPMGEAIGVTSTLSTDSSISGALKELRNSITPYLPAEDREDTINELSEIAEAFEEGWSSDGGFSEDE
ncbi:dml-1 [Sodiomyces alkalinus F11]|uniref:Dml-1 n=1 Tax=Sodiomyces alkalinus (strain CBS 110278 / VKM F-3762 / F11) TaxID=1314773 RepID=A0A3N2PWY5_SODAK|nr:dml-1 [Sodiomyces alkalinus F11]ROT38845.1 dml-1 [Sodiomyces alkalinus F11]